MSTESPGIEPQMNATPLIDVMLVLLIIVIMTVPIATHAVKLNLPQERHAPPQPSVRIDIAFDGALYWDGEFIASVEALTPRFAGVVGHPNRPRSASSRKNARGTSASPRCWPRRNART